MTGSPFKASNGAAGCRLDAVDLQAVALLDSAPQPYVRMEREQVEFWQNVEWSHKAAHAAPAPVTSLGLGGYWFPLQSRMLTTDGVRLDTIKVIWPSGEGRAQAPRDQARARLPGASGQAAGLLDDSTSPVLSVVLETAALHGKQY